MNIAEAIAIDAGAAQLAAGAADAWRWFDILRGEGVRITRNAGLKALKECQEFVDEPSLEEAADVIIAILGASESQGWTLGQVGEAVLAKMKVNRGRTWAQQEDGTFQHIEGT